MNTTRTTEEPEMLSDERRLIATLALAPHLLPDIAADLRAEAFTHGGSRTAYEAMQAMAAASLPIDTGTLGEYLDGRNQRTSAEQMSWSARLWAEFYPSVRFVSEHHARVWARRIRERWMKREAARIGAELVGKFEAAVPGLSEDVAQAVGWLQGEVALLGASARPTRGGPVAQRVHEFAKWVNAPDDDENGIESGVGPLDRYLRALVPGRLYTLAARPGTGKSTMALQVALNVARAGGVVLVLSCEMGEEELYATILANLASIDSERISRRRLTAADQGAFDDAVRRLGAMQLELHETPACTVSRAHSLILKAQHAHGRVDLVVIDYLNLMNPESPKNTPRYLQIGDLARSLKELARRCSTVMLALAQLGRGSERTETPGLADLKESGGIEEHSDVVTMFWRAPDEWEEQHLVRVAVRKNRHGRCGEFKLRHNLEHRRFEPLPDAFGAPRGEVSFV